MVLFRYIFIITLLLPQKFLHASSILFDSSEREEGLLKIEENENNRRVVNQMMHLFHGPGAIIWKKEAWDEENQEKTLREFVELFRGKDPEAVKDMISSAKERLLDSEPRAEQKFLNEFFHTHLPLENFTVTESNQLVFLTLPTTITDLITLYYQIKDYVFKSSTKTEYDKSFIFQCVASTRYLKDFEKRFGLKASDDSIYRILAFDIMHNIQKLTTEERHPKFTQSILRPEFDFILRTFEGGVRPTELTVEDIVRIANNFHGSTILNTISIEASDITLNGFRIWRSMVPMSGPDAPDDLLTEEETELYYTILHKYNLFGFSFHPLAPLPKLEKIITNASMSAPDAEQLRNLCNKIRAVRNTEEEMINAGNCILDFPIPIRSSSNPLESKSPASILKRICIGKADTEEDIELMNTVFINGSFKDFSFGYSVLAGILFDSRVGSVGSCCYTRLVRATSEGTIELNPRNTLTGRPNILYSIGFRKDALPDMNKLMFLPTVPLYQGIIREGEIFHPRVKAVLHDQATIKDSSFLLKDSFLDFFKDILHKKVILEYRIKKIIEFEESPSVPDETANQRNERRAAIVNASVEASEVSLEFMHMVESRIPRIREVATHIYCLTQLLNRFEILNYAGHSQLSLEDGSVDPLSGLPYVAIFATMRENHRKLIDLYRSAIAI